MKKMAEDLQLELIRRLSWTRKKDEKAPKDELLPQRGRTVSVRGAGPLAEKRGNKSGPCARTMR